ncbi:MAG TPA: hypothetical protein VJL90_14820 [Pseudorhodoplanes sp.]|nr:hypothetical protein [Pseudorhodoplanes sp.]
MSDQRAQLWLWRAIVFAGVAYLVGFFVYSNFLAGKTLGEALRLLSVVLIIATLASGLIAALFSRSASAHDSKIAVRWIVAAVLLGAGAVMAVLSI